jgi:hypothetical protein
VPERTTAWESVLPVAAAVAFLTPSDPIHAHVLRLAEAMGLL